MQFEKPQQNEKKVNMSSYFLLVIEKYRSTNSKLEIIKTFNTIYSKHIHSFSLSLIFIALYNIRRYT